MISKDVLADGFGRIQEEVHNAVTGLGADQLARRIDENANSIAWLVWHLTRVQDDHVAEVAGRQQVWLADGWRDRFALDLPARATGYGHTPADVARVRVDAPELLTGYYDATHAVTLSYLDTLRDQDLDRVVDEQWDPPVTLGVRLVSVLSDDLQHAGQAALLRGLFAGR
ncbi:DinB family protein [Pseudonocardia eucalypti]|uniref:DinB family protein n=1 Tax=Pseudonocardia eucalypti TaxID=648755 RepID=A0ABP9PXM8_9PSEU|nr:putative damage-inducible protein DinB [Pseudonocardia eucalypti]